MWKIKDFVDLEYFFYLDREKDQEHLIKRDRLLFINKISNEHKDKPSQIKKWAELRQSEEDDREELPGEIYNNGYLLLKNILIVIGIVSGFTITSSFLWYDGKTPINVSSFFFVLIILQMLLLVSLLFAVLFRSKLRSLTFLSPLVKRLLKKLSIFVLKNTYQKLSSKNTKNFDSKMGFIKAQKLIYGHIFKWQIFNATQLFAIFFNLAILLTLLFKVFTADLALGWQSTAEIQNQTLYKTVEVIATPWSWFITENAYPSPEQIEGSRIILKDGIYHLQSEALTSWWPFLCLSILFYGLLPRLLFFIVGYLGQRRAINHFPFNSANCNRLLRRFETQYVEIDDSSSTIIQSQEKDAQISEGKTAKVTSSDNYQTFVWESIAKLYADSYLQQQVQQKLTYDIKPYEIETSLDGEDKALEYLEKISPEGTVILQASWKPPIGEAMEFIEDIRNISKQKEIIVALIGKPNKNKQEKIDTKDFKMWNTAVAKLGDPFTSVVCLGEKNE
ncbi:DUF2868 domain-containing protein [Candidatus Uabimicrobium sp. HlEnr_7]|uniref:DUF2868 domain-containing protein n=1 Tax=Candidatus Uabimicrobium helgolandensis TaxID=3095367 RepID=UPI003558BBA2